jgi:hypothetical protein
MIDDFLNLQASFLPDLTPIDVAFLKDPEWALALRDKDRRVAKVGLERFLYCAGFEKSCQTIGFAPLVLPGERCYFWLSEDCLAAMAAIASWWDKHPFAWGQVVFIREDASPSELKRYDFQPGFMNVVFPCMEYFELPLIRECLPGVLKSNDGVAIHPVFGVMNGGSSLCFFRESLSHRVPALDLSPGFGAEVNSLVNDPARILAMLRYMTRLASEE